ncbi:Protein of unknown function [Pyronema omphalodes CBS 100304]|uniref:Uncharacterized protein n=1 Tax=Pyronema omphalodes (strain CBS 100304) TaxID=1076935 RepID=U4LKX3_PYROM|nr:Protein of unknown function [Pyronema omphalodes CBS 100304]
MVLGNGKVMASGEIFLQFETSNLRRSQFILINRTACPTSLLFLVIPRRETTTCGIGIGNLSSWISLRSSVHIMSFVRERSKTSTSKLPAIRRSSEILLFSPMRVKRKYTAASFRSDLRRYYI